LFIKHISTPKPSTMFAPSLTRLARRASSLLSLLAFLLLSTNALQAQTETTSPKPRVKAMQLVGGKVYYNNMPLTAGDAQFYAMAKSAPAAAAFRKAARIRGWNYFWWSYGGLNAVTGVAQLSSGIAEFQVQGALNVAVGGVLVGITIPREQRRQRLLAFGVSEYNKALNEDSWED
jgi:hypothetical protein